MVETLTRSEWIAQSKYDGWRMLIHVESANIVHCLTRVGKPMRDAAKAHAPANLEDQFIALGLPDGTVLDTEFVGPRGNHKLGVYIFDCLRWDNKWLTKTPFEDRWKLCMDLAPRLAGNDLIHLARTENDRPLMDFFNDLKDQWIEGGGGMDLCEGIVIKRRSGGLHLDRNSSKKSSNQFKLKYRDITDRRY